MTGFRVTQHQDRPADTGWMTDAACADHPSLPWTGDPNRVPKTLKDRMRGVCAGCPVRARCATYAVEARITAGWWAGRNLNGFTHTHPPTAEDMRSDAA